MPRRPLLLVFDYDHSLINDNSDTYVPHKLEANRAIEILNAWVKRREAGDDLREDDVRGWNELMDLLVRTFQLQDGKTIQDIKDAAASVPFDPHMLEIIRRFERSAASKIVILSDANDVYINSFLQHHKLEGMIHRVFTNPTRLDENGILRVGPYHGEPHGCAHCPPNLCKGMVYMDEIYRRGDDDDDFVVAYVGDGSGDFCPCTKLGPGDLVFCRNDPREPRARGLMRKIEKSPAGSIKAEIVEWTSGKQILDRLVAEGLLS